MMTWIEKICMYVGAFLLTVIGLCVTSWVIFAGVEAARLYWFDETFRKLNKGKYSFWQVWWEEMKCEL